MNRFVMAQGRLGVLALYGAAGRSAWGCAPRRRSRARRRLVRATRIGATATAPSSCEVREFTVAATAGTLTVAGTNGGISVEGESRGDVRILAKVVATAETDARAREIAGVDPAQPDARTGRGRRPARPAEPRGMVGQLPPVRAARAQPVARAPATAASPSARSTRRSSSGPRNGGVKLIGVSGDVKGQTTQRRRGHRSRRHRPGSAKASTSKPPTAA